ncbi:MAG: hypothetical protein ACOC56_01815, partial [Atribacterota bacterium]
IFLYRGYKKVGKVFKIKPRTNRIPRNTSLLVHDILDEKFKKKFGWKARSEGVFVVGNASEAGTYSMGEVFLFFPAGNYKYIWSPTINDLYLYSDFIITMPEKFDKILESYTDKDLKKYMNNQTFYCKEIMFKCNEYYLVHVDFADLVLKKIRGW